ncbi:MAG: hypothetical protein Q8O86_07990 [Dehalococcoidia bacterium]|nr:hypothetical protein [Dehalococcoidia bacterium]
MAVRRVKEGVEWYETDRRRYYWSGAVLALVLLAFFFAICRPGPLPEQVPVRPYSGQPETPASRGRIYFPLLMAGRADDIGPAAIVMPTPSPTASPAPTSSPTPAPTPTRTPVPTPAPPTPTATPFPGPIAKITKMGVGVYTSGGGYLVEAIYRLRPTAILLMDPSLDFAREVRHWFPKAFIVGRRYVKDQPLDNPEQRGRAFADHVAEVAVPLKGVVDAWASYNEVTDNGNYENYRAYNAFQVAFARRLQGVYGIAAMAGNDAAGTVQPEDYARYFREAIESSQYFGIHAYAPKGAESMAQDATYHALRYRLIHGALVAAGVKHGPFVLTETGLWDGWRGYLSDEQMAREFMWLSDEMDQDDYVLGQAIFGIFDRNEWESFNILGTSVPDRLGRYKDQVK